MIILPWFVVLVTVPNVGGIFGRTSWLTLSKILVFGFGWGIGSVLFGLGIDRLGLGLGYGIILGLDSLIGTFLPLLVLHAQ
jgi:L-rhamnose-H+ transport protein